MQRPKFYGKLALKDTITIGTHSDAPKARALLEFEQITPNCLIVCLQREFRKFAKFSNHVEFSNFLLKLEEPFRSYYEIIFQDQPQKPYIDAEIDLDMPEIKSSCMPLNAGTDGIPMLKINTEIETIPAKKTGWTLERAISVAKNIRNIMAKVARVNEDNVIVTNSHGPNKASFHFILDNYCVSDNREARNFHDKMVEMLSEKDRAMIDHRMYKSIQQFRIYGCHKMNSSRVKKIDEICTWKPKVPIYTKEELEMNLLLASYVTNSSYCQILSGFNPPMSERKIFSENLDCCVLPQDISRLNDMLKDALFTKHLPFSFEEIKGSIIILKRLSPSLCPMCKRIHQNENAFITIFGNERSVWFHCRRNDDKANMNIGSLGVIPPRIIETITPYDELVKLYSGDNKELEAYKNNPSDAGDTSALLKSLPVPSTIPMKEIDRAAIHNICEQNHGSKPATKADTFKKMIAAGISTSLQGFTFSLPVNNLSVKK